MVRRAGTEDVEGLWRVHVAAIRTTCAMFYDAAVIQAWTSRLSPNKYLPVLADHILWVAERRGGIVGFAQFDPTTTSLRALYVDPAASGFGVGSMLLSTVEQFARNAGHHRLQLESTLNAESFYAARGYTAREQRVHSLPGTTGIPCVAMDKRL